MKTNYNTLSFYGNLVKEELTEINKVEMCAECDMLKKELSSYCLPCWNSKMQN